MRQLLVVMVALVGCSNRLETAMTESQHFTDEMCECKDVACVDTTMAKRAAWSSRVRVGKVSQAELERAAAIELKFHACRRTVLKTAGVWAADKRLDRLTVLKDQMCACKDAACVDDIQADVTKFVASFDESASDLLAENEEDERAQKAVTDVMAKCSADVQLAAAGLK